MIRILTIVGARPQIIKAAAISRAIKNYFSDKITEIIVHTGQHYDENMSDVFFEELEVPKEKYNFNAGSGSHAEQTAAIMLKTEEILLKEKPDCLLLYGDTNSTLAAAVAAAKIHLPVIHVEGGVRSYNKKFPEEVNRLICDHLSTLIFVPTLSGIKSLQQEGFNLNNLPPYSSDNPKAYHCGDIMYDNSLYFADKAAKQSKILQQLDVENKNFILVTMHRPSNVDDIKSLNELFKTFDELAKQEKTIFVLPLHPRTIKAFENNLERRIYKNVKENSFLKLIPAVSFLDVINLEKNAEMVITDSGGVQKEAYYFKRPCIIMLEETPWVELVESGSAILTGSDSEKIKSAYKYFKENIFALKYPEIFGDGKASVFVCEKIIEAFSK
ncbi:MAG: UDP-N-acetylglucosamine 2-epimerase (non-hydrolyzing) [Bacteroidia bacterium]